MMEVFDYTVGDSRFSIVSEGEEIKYVIIAGHHYSVEDFEKMVFIYNNFNEEDARAEHDTTRADG
jgi:hypothetical protein